MFITIYKQGMNMNNQEALNWLLVNVQDWDKSTIDSPRDCFWLVMTTEKGIELMLASTNKGCTSGYEWIITKEEWLDAQPMSDSESVFIDKPVAEAKTGLKIYIAGPMTGYVDSNYPAFNEKADLIRLQGNTPLNPAIGHVGLSQLEYMQLSMQMVFMSDKLFMLKGWEESKGAIAEHALADKLELAIEYEE